MKKTTTKTRTAALAEEIFCDYPSLRKTVCVIDREKLGNDPERIEKAVLRHLKKNKAPALSSLEQQRLLRSLVRHCDIFPDTAFFLHRGATGFLVFSATRNARPLTPALSPEQNRRYCLDHEFGHVLTCATLERKITNPAQLKHALETAADVFATIRDCQKTGGEAARVVRSHRLKSTIEEGKYAYLTIAGIDRVLELRTKSKIKNLSPQDVVNLSIEIALATSAQWKPKSLSAAFSPIARLAEKGADQQRLFQKAATIHKTAASPQIRKLARDYLALSRS